jgi:hypothetical protein
VLAHACSHARLALHMRALTALRLPSLLLNAHTSLRRHHQSPEWACRASHEPISMLASAVLELSC